jgi:2-dehydro-3-deoxyphosphogluconate aldolase/(4S)-4-hydroxy-2-oxoglutarate aldolase
VKATNAADFIAAGAFALGVGADLVDAVALREGNLEKISAAAQELVQAVISARAVLREKKPTPVSR